MTTNLESGPGLCCLPARLRHLVGNDATPDLMRREAVLARKRVGRPRLVSDVVLALLR